jgi:actin-related protein 5
MHTQTFFSNDYVKDLKTLADVNDIEFFNNLDATIQFPYVEPVINIKIH